MSAELSCNKRTTVRAGSRSAGYETVPVIAQPFGKDDGGHLTTKRHQMEAGDSNTITHRSKPMPSVIGALARGPPDEGCTADGDQERDPVSVRVARRSDIPLLDHLSTMTRSDRAIAFCHG